MSYLILTLEIWPSLFLVEPKSTFISSHLPASTMPELSSILVQLNAHYHMCVLRRADTYYQTFSICIIRSILVFSKLVSV
jgi:hypothetical protein